MPFQEYNTAPGWDKNQLRGQNNKLIRIASKAMRLLEELGKEDFLLIKDKEVRDWWTEHKIANEAAEKLKNTKRNMQRQIRAARKKIK